MLASLHILDRHVAYLGETISDTSCRLVGGCVRDVLLGLTTQPHDIDVTCQGEPLMVKTHIDTSQMDFFMTEKYGTMTLIPYQEATENVSEGEKKLQYELTPFRGEGEYTDGRRPDEVIWSDDLVDDAMRRDFTINSLYYIMVKNDGGRMTNDGGKVKDEGGKIKDEGGKTKNLPLPRREGGSPLPPFEGGTAQQQGRYYDSGANVLVVTDQVRIRALVVKGQVQADVLQMYGVSSGCGILIDPCGGLQDIMSTTIRAVGDPDRRFTEDGLRIMRAVRLTNVLTAKLLRNNPSYDGSLFDIEKVTRKSLKKNYYRLQWIAKERIKQEIDKVFAVGDPFAFVALLDELNVLKYIFPALYACKNVAQPVRYHPFDVYVHSILTLYHLQTINTSYLVRLGMLYHDVGKVEQYSTYVMGLDQEETREMFGSRLNHVTCGVDLARRDFQALGYSTKEIDEICRYVAHHMKPGEILDAHPHNQVKKIRTYLSEVGAERTRNLLDISRGDRLGQYNPMQGPQLQGLARLNEIIDDLIAREGEFTIKQLAVDGATVMKELQIGPGPRVGELLRAAFERVSEDIAGRNRREVITEWMKDGGRITKDE